MKISKNRFSNSLFAANSVIMEYHLKACKVPPEFRDMVIEIIQKHLSSLSSALGNLELCYLRTKQHSKKK